MRGAGRCPRSGCVPTVRVCLMDGDEYQAHLDGYEYFGGFYDVTPVVL